MKVLAIDIGGNNVKMLATGYKTPVKFSSGPTLTPSKMVAGVKKLARNWDYDVISIGVPGPVLLGELIMDPRNLGPGWVDFDFGAAFGVPVKVVNDAAMQALGSYREGKMLFFGLGTGLGTALVINGVAESREIGQLPYKNGTLEEYVGALGMKRMGKKKWRKHVNELVTQVLSKVHADDVVLGGGQVKYMKKLPDGCREGSNANAFLGGFRLWEEPASATATVERTLKVMPGGRKAKSRPTEYHAQSGRPTERRAVGHR